MHTPGCAFLAPVLKNQLAKPKSMLSHIVIPSQQTKHERKSKPVLLLPMAGVGEQGKTRTDGG